MIHINEDLSMGLIAWIGNIPRCLQLLRQTTGMLTHQDSWWDLGLMNHSCIQARGKCGNPSIHISSSSSINMLSLACHTPLSRTLTNEQVYQSPTSLLPPSTTTSINTIANYKRAECQNVDGTDLNDNGCPLKGPRHVATEWGQGGEGLGKRCVPAWYT